MLRAGTLIIVLVISLVMGLISTSLILLAYYNRLQVHETALEKRLRRNVRSGVNLLLSGADLVKPGEEKQLDLYGEGTDSILLKKSRWGLFEIGIVRSFYGAASHIEVFFAGKEAGDKEKISLHLTDQNRPLSVAGKTKIIGDAYLPAASVRKAYIDGRAFEGEQIVQGTIFTSQAQLPSLDPVILEYLEAYLSFPADTLLPGAEVITVILPDGIDRSFLEDVLIIRTNGPVNLENVSLTGNITLVSGGHLTIPSSAKLEDIIVFAPSVVIKEGFNGSLQVFSRDSIRIEKNCRLDYPSAVGLIKKQDSLSVESTQPELNLEAGSRFSGIIFTKALDNDDFQQTRVTIHKDAIVNGQVYADGYLDLKGKVYGSAYCNRFILQTPSTLYENHLLDAVIDYRSLSVYYTGSQLINTGKKGRIVKWTD